MRKINKTPPELGRFGPPVGFLVAADKEGFGDGAQIGDSLFVLRFVTAPLGGEPDSHFSCSCDDIFLVRGIALPIRGSRLLFL